MYWLRASYSINSLADIQFLSTIFQEADGELTFKTEEFELQVYWTLDPFAKLIELLHQKISLVNSSIKCRLCGPDTIRGVSQRPERLERESFEHEKKELILWWSDRIDSMVHNEMDRVNDIGYIYEDPPLEKYINMNELFLAIRLSKYATHVIPGESGFLIANEKSTYLSYIGILDLSPEEEESIDEIGIEELVEKSHEEVKAATKEEGDLKRKREDEEELDSVDKIQKRVKKEHKRDTFSEGLVFDKDDGFIDVFRGNKSLSYLNEKFYQWVDSKYSGKLSDYYDKY